MLSPRYFWYMVVGRDLPSQTGISSKPMEDAAFLLDAGYREIWIAKPSLPILAAEHVQGLLVEAGLPSKLTAVKKLVKRAYRGYNLARAPSVEVVSLAKLEVPERELPEIESLLWGKSLLGSEIPGLLRESGYDLPWDTEEWMQVLVLRQLAVREAAVSRDPFGLPVCRRCGSTMDISEEYCHLCGRSDCLTCHNCQSLGIAKSCLPLYFAPYPTNQGHGIPVSPKLEFDLTMPQQRAARQVAEFYESREQEFLIWAVCGSGKTEVSFGIVAQVLSKGGSVLLAIPRKDIVIELLPRMSKAFPEIKIQALYGGCGEQGQVDTQLVIATTHQCLRFYHRFDLAILDEADAFPYIGSEMLHYALKRALQPDGKMVIMTATPARNLVERARGGKLPYVSIPARYHRRPLAVPQFITQRLPGSQQRNLTEPPQFVQELLLNEVKKQRRLLIFLPTIKLIDTIGRNLVAWAELQGLRGACTHSRLDNRLEVKEKLNCNELDFAVVSTIFERGITIADLDVLVLYADFETIFDSRTLIQIAGRVGRKGDWAQVWFVAERISRSMKECVKQITDMNQEAQTLGYLDVTD